MVSGLNITTPTAYARITSIFIDIVGNVKAIVEIQQNRDAIGNFKSLEKNEINFIYDKVGNPYESAYELLKIILGEGWLDDNPVENNLAEEILQE